MFLTRSARRRLSTGILLALAIIAMLATSTSAQRRFRRGFVASSDWIYDGSFIFCRVAYSEAWDGDGGGWDVDYPQADSNLPWRARQLSSIPVSLDSRGEPNHVVVTLDDPHLFQCPFIMMTEVGALSLSEQQATNLRLYLQKGGFLWADDFWGSYAWAIWEREMNKVFPGVQMTDVPPNHPLFHMLYNTKPTQIPSLGSWYGLGFDTSERGNDSRPAHIRAIMDDNNDRIMVVISHNTDYGDAFEREGQDRAYFNTFAGDAYAFGVNTILYGLTH